MGRASVIEATLRRTVLHEFGHALGCLHEQASPGFGHGTALIRLVNNPG